MPEDQTTASNASLFGSDITLDNPTYIDPTALIHGKVHIGPKVTMWPYSVIRAENFQVTIGEGSNIQDFVMIHQADESPVTIGRWSSITHHVTLHGCTIGDHVLIGINATVMDGAVVGDNSIIGAGAVVSPGQVIPPNSIAAGVPAKVLKTRNNLVANRLNAEFYYQNGMAYARGDYRVTQQPGYAENMARVRAEAEALAASQAS